MNVNNKQAEQITIGVRVTAETHARLAAVAKRQERSVSAIVRIAIKNTLAEAESQQPELRETI